MHKKRPAVRKGGMNPDGLEPGVVIGAEFSSAGLARQGAGLRQLSGQRQHSRARRVPRQQADPSQRHCGGRVAVRPLVHEARPCRRVGTGSILQAIASGHRAGVSTCSSGSVPARLAPWRGLSRHNMTPQGHGDGTATPPRQAATQMKRSAWASKLLMPGSTVATSVADRPIQRPSGAASCITE